jgi:hypothetical protein
MTTTIREAIQSLKPGSEFSYNNEDYSTIKWDVLDGTAPTEKQITDEIERLDELKSQEVLIKAEARALKVSAYTKLGLTEDEINAIIGAE